MRDNRPRGQPRRRRRRRGSGLRHPPPTHRQDYIVRHRRHALRRRLPPQAHRETLRHPAAHGPRQLRARPGLGPAIRRRDLGGLLPPHDGQAALDQGTGCAHVHPRHAGRFTRRAGRRGGAEGEGVPGFRRHPRSRAQTAAAAAAAAALDARGPGLPAVALPRAVRRGQAQARLRHRADLRRGGQGESVGDDGEDAEGAGSAADAARVGGRLVCGLRRHQVRHDPRGDVRRVHVGGVRGGRRRRDAVFRHGQGVDAEQRRRGGRRVSQEYLFLRPVRAVVEPRVQTVHRPVEFERRDDAVDDAGAFAAGVAGTPRGGGRIVVARGQSGGGAGRREQGAADRRRYAGDRGVIRVSPRQHCETFLMYTQSPLALRDVLNVHIVAAHVAKHQHLEPRVHLRDFQQPLLARAARSQRIEVAAAAPALTHRPAQREIVSAVPRRNLRQVDERRIPGHRPASRAAAARRAYVILTQRQHRDAEEVFPSKSRVRGERVSNRVSLAAQRPRGHGNLEIHASEVLRLRVAVSGVVRTVPAPADAQHGEHGFPSLSQPKLSELVFRVRHREEHVAVLLHLLDHAGDQSRVLVRHLLFVSCQATGREERSKSIRRGPRRRRPLRLLPPLHVHVVPSEQPLVPERLQPPHVQQVRLHVAERGGERLEPRGCTAAQRHRQLESPRPLVAPPPSHRVALPLQRGTQVRLQETHVLVVPEHARAGVHQLDLDGGVG
mmetsp:Transcript_14693/g.63578  ORF Transcript_14693/g.63578 Transcript_14693/m.63578 type:complete len:721 (+) Transcript_14693:338-2500(+)